MKEGDPLFPVLFNMVMETLLRELDKEIAVEIEEGLTNHIAYADDVVLLARTTSGLKLLLEKFKFLTNKAGLNTNMDKTRVLRIRSLCHLGKRVITDPKMIIVHLKPILHGEHAKYLGIYIGPYGIFSGYILQDLTALLQKLKTSPTKPQQKLWVLKLTNRKVKL